MKAQSGAAARERDTRQKSEDFSSYKKRSREREREMCVHSDIEHVQRCFFFGQFYVMVGGGNK